MMLLAYPLFGTLVAFTTLQSLVASAPVRGMVLALSIVLIYQAPSSLWKNKSVWVVLLFWALYLARLLWDYFIEGIPLAGEFMFKFLWFSIPPAIAFLCAPLIDEKKLTRQLLALGTVACMLAIVAYYSDLAGARSFTSEAEGRLFLDTVNPITFGHVGVTTMLAAISALRYSTRLVDWFFVIGSACLGVVTIQLAGSRGPLIALVVCLLTLAFFVKSYRWLFVPIIIGGLWMFVGVSADGSGYLASRLTSTVANGSPEIRTLMAQNALGQFLENQIIGSMSIDLQFEDHPHNPFLEAAMATGAFGLGLLVFIYVKALASLIYALRHGAVLMPLLAIQALVGAQVSGSIAESASMWIFLAYFLGMRETPIFGRPICKTVGSS